ncbi:uncharacterized protein isoform X1 [Salmo salar]|uniref:Uncharacterized protein isoform X1 n=1 Tax=Salmo salar TaxID=8030 RepID=A0A1S3P668_SALSA|nr:uncharacterized protein LOC106583445 isoform X1 [Salmo salar]|eukprot:XP_014023092.1 PREDICTED: uncharacterized protein LOC106583445 isoform X1 [Salmo salar]
MATENMEMNGDADGENGGEVPHLRGRNHRATVGTLNMNHYANKKSAAESMLDVALLMANASQLKAVLEQGPGFTFYNPLITLISISLILQVTVGILLIFIGQRISGIQSSIGLKPSGSLFRQRQWIDQLYRTHTGLSYPQPVNISEAITNSEFTIFVFLYSFLRISIRLSVALSRSEFVNFVFPWSFNLLHDVTSHTSSVAIYML